MNTAVDTNVRKNNECECTITPAVDIIETKDGYTLYADMPGTSKENLDISIENMELTIEGGTGSSKEAAPSYREFELGKYRRKFLLNQEIDSEKISATVDKGVLKLLLPKREAAKPRQIQIKTA
jgi:HSP20 family molecular chaperone IbpA